MPTLCGERFLYVGTPKCGSRAVSHWLEESGHGSRLPIRDEYPDLHSKGHLPAYALPSIVASRKVIASVRHPADWLLSAYHYWRTDGAWVYQWTDGHRVPWPEWLDAITSAEGDFWVSVYPNTLRASRRCSPYEALMRDYTDGAHDIIRCDHIAEDLARGLAGIIDTPVSLPPRSHHIGNYDHTAHWWSTDLLRLIEGDIAYYEALIGRYGLSVCSEGHREG